MEQISFIENYSNNFTQKIQKKFFDTEVFDQIVRFLRNHSRNSKHTALNYERDIRNFFNVTRNKDIEHLVKSDLVFKIEEIEDYYAYLLDVQKVSKSSANRYLSSVKECFKHLNQRGLIDNISFMEIKTFNEPAKQYGILSPDEIEQALQIVLHQGKKDVALKKYLLIKFAVDTSARLSECLSLKWSNFSIQDNFVKINAIGKGNKEFKPIISKELYNELLQIKSNNEYVFDIHRNTINRMMKDLRKKMNIPNERNIVFHSFRKAGVDHIWKKTRDLNQARKAANHSSTQVTERYIDTEEEYGVLGMFSSREGVDEDLYKKVEYELLLKAISELDKGQQMYINIKLNELISSKNDV